MSDTELDLGALRALMDERASCVRTIEGAGMHDNYTDAARARDRKWTVECQLLNAFPALLAAAGEREALRADVERLRAYIASDAQCPCCGRSDECASHCTFLQDDGDVCAAMEHARSVLAALAPAAAKDARSPAQSDGGAT